jgi:IMP cyclohydrolase
MYIGRIVALGKTLSGNNCAMYRVSSRSFPNRQAVLKDKTVTVVPRPGFEQDLQKNPYITYNCIRLERNCAIVSNGSHTDPIAEKIAMGMPVRDAVSLGLLAMDYEKDAFNTPRIVAVVAENGDEGYLGIIRHDALLVKSFKLQPGKINYIATYEHIYPCGHYQDDNFTAVTAESACQYVINGGIFAGFEHPVTAASAMAAGDGFTLSAVVV